MEATGEAAAVQSNDEGANGSALREDDDEEKDEEKVRGKILRFSLFLLVQAILT